MFENMKMSKYNFTTYDHEGNLIVYNFLTGLPSLTKVMKTDIDKFTQLFLTNDEIHSTSYEKYADAVESLLKSGILVASDTDESVLNDAKYYEEVYDSKLFLVILPTGECNFNCSYCFEAEKPFSRNAMTVDAQNAILKFVQKQIHNHKEVQVSWFGGEPLLEPQIIKHISENLIKICKARFLPYSADISTNGFFLDADMFDMLYKLKVYRYMITVDGFKEQHDKLRFARNGMGTYDVIMDNLLRIRNNKQYKFANITIRINVTKSFFDILDDFIYFIESSFSDDPRFSFMFVPAGDYSKVKCSDDDIFVDSTEVMSRLLKNEVYVNKLYPEENKIYPITQGRKCIASLKNSYAITPDLKVYKCHVNYDMGVNNIGYISSNGDLLLDETLHSKWYLTHRFAQSIPDGCKDCFYFPACNNSGKKCPALYLKTKPEVGSCPFENDKEMKVLVDSVLYAVYKYPYATLVL